MLKIMLCDDDGTDLQALQRLVKEYWEDQEKVPIRVSLSRSASEVIKSLEAGEVFDLYILDILMEETDGIELGKRIRQFSETSAIVYATSSPEFALGAFGVHASGYLLKPIAPELFAECMGRVTRHFFWKQKLMLSVKTKAGIRVIDSNKLMWVENVSRVMHYYLEDGEIVESVYIRKPFEEQIKEVLEDFRFIQTHKSFVVNAQFVGKMLLREFVMVDNTIIPISRKNQGAVKKAYLEYLSKIE